MRVRVRARVRVRVRVVVSTAAGGGARSEVTDARAILGRGRVRGNSVDHAACRVPGTRRESTERQDAVHVIVESSNYVERK